MRTKGILMAIPNSKIELQNDIKLTYTKLKIVINKVPVELCEPQLLVGHSKGTMMSVRDLLCYLIGWGELVLKWINNKDNGIKVDFPETDFKWNELGKLAQKFYRDYGEYTFEELKLKLDDVVILIESVISQKSNLELYEILWYEKYTLGRMIQLNTISPYKNAKLRISKFLSTNGLKLQKNWAEKFQIQEAD